MQWNTITCDVINLLLEAADTGKELWSYFLHTLCFGQLLIWLQLPRGSAGATAATTKWRNQLPLPCHSSAGGNPAKLQGCYISTAKDTILGSFITELCKVIDRDQMWNSSLGISSEIYSHLLPERVPVIAETPSIWLRQSWVKLVLLTTTGINRYSRKQDYVINHFL